MFCEIRNILVETKRDSFCRSPRNFTILTFSKDLNFYFSRKNIVKTIIISGALAK